MAALSLIGLSGCSGAADAAPTVGPTAGADESVEPAEYEPTLPPYTSEVDLSAEDEAEVEELLLLIDEFSTYTSTLDSASLQTVESLDDSVDKQMLEQYWEGMKEAYEEGKRTSGLIVPESTVLLSLDMTEATVATCYDFSDYTVYEENQPGVHIYPDRPIKHAYDTVAKRSDSGWILIDRFDSEIECDE
ncbi:MAG: hypothetical protein ACTHXF_00885 [Brevibacterium yomogidense]